MLAHVLALPLAIGAFAAGLLCALGVGYLRDHSRVKEDAVMAVVFSGLFALGLVIVREDRHGPAPEPHPVRNMLGVRWRDVAETALIALP